MPSIPGRLLAINLAIGEWVATTAIPWVAEKALGLGAAVFGWLADFVPTIPARLAAINLAVADWITADAIPWITEKAAALASSLLGWVAATVSAIPERLVDIAAAIGSWIIDTAVPFVLGKALELRAAMLAWITDAVTELPGRLLAIADTILTWIGTLPDAIRTAAAGMWDGITEAFTSVINFLIDAWNRLDFGIDIKLPDFLGGAGFVVDDIIPDIPRLAAGGIVPKTPGGTLAMIGEGRYDEAVIPLSPDVLAQLGGGDQALLHVEHMHIEAPTELALGQGLAEAALRAAAPAARRRRRGRRTPGRCRAAPGRSARARRRGCQTGPRRAWRTTGR